MAAYHITFYGRLKGAIGVTYRIHDTVDAPTIDAATLKLYDKYEHIQVVTVSTEENHD